MTRRRHPKEDKTLAGLCFAAALALALFALYLVFTPARYLVVAFLGLVAILVLMGRQRLTQYRMNPHRFGVITRNLGFFVAIAAAVGVVVAVVL